MLKYKIHRKLQYGLAQWFHAHLRGRNPGSMPGPGSRDDLGIVAHKRQQGPVKMDPPWP